MKFIALPVILIAISCSPQVNYSTYGEEVSPESPMTTAAFLTSVGSDSSEFKITGTVESVCQMKGCWMTIKNDQNQSIRVTFKDYGFFVPKDIAGREVIIEGNAIKTELEEDMAKHYAEDAGKEYDPSMKNEVSIVASGVLVRDI
ncbi:MAG: DUF4920 domain-containing protein [Cyclobacteriaceae bacterium]